MLLHEPQSLAPTPRLVVVIEPSNRPADVLNKRVPISDLDRSLEWSHAVGVVDINLVQHIRQL